MLVAWQLSQDREVGDLCKIVRSSSNSCGPQTVVVDEPAGWTITLADAPAPAAADPSPQEAVDIPAEDVPVAFQEAA